MAVVAHPIVLVSHGVFAFTRFMAVVFTLALALILGHPVPRGILVCIGGNAPSSRPKEIQRAAASSQCMCWPISSTMFLWHHKAWPVWGENSSFVCDRRIHLWAVVF